MVLRAHASFLAWTCLVLACQALACGSEADSVPGGGGTAGAPGVVASGGTASASGGTAGAAPATAGMATGGDANAAGTSASGNGGASGSSTSAAGTGGLAGGSSGSGGSSVGGTAGGGGNSAGGAGGNSGAFNPCPALPEPCKVMASGDSITVGAQSTDTGGYRVALFHTALQHSKQLTFVGPSGAGPSSVDNVPFPDKHDGHSGYIIDTVDSRKGLLPLMAGNLDKFKPNIVLLMIGTNDMNSNVDIPGAPARLAKLLDLVTTSAPDTLLVVAQLIPTRTDSLNDSVKKFNAELVNLVKARAQQGKHIVSVDMYGAFTANANYKTAWLFDGLHPNDAGYAKMADVWYPAISGFLH